MKRINFLTIAVSLSGILIAQQPSSKTQLEVQQTVVKMFQALSDRDSIG